MSYDFASQPFTVLVPNTPEDPAYHAVSSVVEPTVPPITVPETTTLQVAPGAPSVTIPVPLTPWDAYNFTQTDTEEQNPVAGVLPTVVSLDDTPDPVPPVQYLGFPGLLVPHPLGQAPFSIPPVTAPFAVPNVLPPQALQYPIIPGVTGAMVLPSVATNVAALTPQQLSSLVPNTLVPGSAAVNNIVPSTVVAPPVPLDSNSPSKSAPAPTGDCHWINITNYLNLPQSEAAKQLNIPTSSLSKRWKESARNRKWPYRAVCKLDKEIMTLMHNIPPGSTLPPDIEEKLSKLLKERQEMLKPVIIRL